ncbi:MULTISPECIES: PhoU domain-containing protein [Nocardiaceae]|uniref:Phosphate-specific transport system accessory protein PhoU n=1 Tax=Rhodococcoides corynebacterioides TaxID=53972 RepID=A0ABS2KZ29_9NOCA|nr:MULTISPECIES: PhoU domain-containing protein [Rhodococcus]MBM7417192.1 phosphate transport system protein [Rhodococcus corynebacterioides]MBP1115445.1 phosphate transport system protein [Rhodococcus sp. PvP016]
MRTAYTAQLEGLNDDLCALAQAAETAMRDASIALLDGDLQAAESVIARGEALGELGARCEDKAVTVLALQAPVAADLRRVFSAVRISSDLSRMVGLAVHIAEAARRRFPEPIVPDHLTPQFREMSELCLDMSGRIVDALRTSDLGRIDRLSSQNDRVDSLKTTVVDTVSADDRGHDVMNAVDIALLGRYFERYADQIIDVASRIVFFVSGRKQLA